MLKNYLLTQGFTKDKIDALTPAEFAKWIETDNNVSKLITYKTGEYKTRLESGKDYTITVTPNDVQSTVTVTIHFDKLAEKNSLSEYSVQYTI